MTTLKQIKPVFNFIKKNSRFILQSVLVDDGFLKMTDMETSLSVKNTFGLENGIHSIETLGLDGPRDCNVDDFPLFANDIDNTMDIVSIDSQTIDEFLPFVSKDETRLHLCGLAINDNHLVATNGHFLKKQLLSVNTNNNYIIPKSSLLVLSKMLKKFKNKKHVDVKLTDSFAYVITDKFQWQSRLIKRDYPKWQSVIPKKTKQEFTINNWVDFSEFKHLLNKTNFSCKVKLENGNVMLSAINSKLNKTNTYNIGNCDSDLDFEVGFNANYIDIIMKKNKSITFKYNNELAPFIFETAYDDGVLMPLRI